MAKNTSFHDYIFHDRLGNVPGISSRAMFGGFAIYRDGVIFAILVGGEVYFKVDDTNRVEFERMGSRPFEYAKDNGKRITMSYWLVPDEILEDDKRLLELIDKSVAVSRKKKSKS